MDMCTTQLDDLVCTHTTRQHIICTLYVETGSSQLPMSRDAMQCNLAIIRRRSNTSANLLRTSNLDFRKGTLYGEGWSRRHISCDQMSRSVKQLLNTSSYRVSPNRAIRYPRRHNSIFAGDSIGF